MKRSLILERDDLTTVSSSKKACTSLLNDYCRNSNTTSKCSRRRDLFPVSVNQEIFSELLSSYVKEYKLSCNNSKIEHSLIQENRSNRESNLKAVCISAINSALGKTKNTFEITSTVSDVKCENISVSNSVTSNPAMKRSVILERNDLNSESHSKMHYISTIVNDHVKSDNTSECTNIIRKDLFSVSLNQDIFSELLSSDGNESRNSISNSKVEHSPILENNGSNNESLSKEACISTKNDDYGLSNGTFKITSNISDGKCEEITVNSSVPSTPTNNQPHDVSRLYRTSNNSLDGLVSTLNKLDSTNKTLVSEFQSDCQDPSTSARNFGLCSYDYIPKNINNIMNSLMKDGNCDIEILPFLIEKIRIRNKLAISLNNRIAKLKDDLKETKRQVDNSKPEHPNEKQTQCMNVLETIIKELDDLPFIFFKNTTPSTSDVIPKRIKSIILETKNLNKNNTLNINTLEIFFNKVKNKKNVRTVADSLNIPVDHLKNQLNEIKMNYKRNPERGNKEEKQFMKRLERIINCLKRKPSSSARSSTLKIPDINHECTDEIISKIKSGTLDVTMFMKFLNKAKNKKNLISIAKSAKIDVDDIKRYLKTIKSRYDENLDSTNDKEKLFVKRLKRIIRGFNRRLSTFDESSYQDIPDTIRERTKKIIWQLKSGTLEGTKFMKFLNNAKNRKHLISIAKLSKIDISDLKKILKAMKSRYDRNLESANDKEKQFVKWLERLIDQLESTEFLNTKLKNSPLKLP